MFRHWAKYYRKSNKNMFLKFYVNFFKNKFSLQGPRKFAAEVFTETQISIKKEPLIFSGTFLF